MTACNRCSNPVPKRNRVSVIVDLVARQIFIDFDICEKCEAELEGLPERELLEEFLKIKNRLRS